MTLIVCGIRQDNGKVRHIKSFLNKKWADKYIKAAGDKAVVKEVQVEDLV